MASIHDIADYIILRLTEGNVPLNPLKLQKLVYYIQMWHYAHFERPMFEGQFQAWIHGPVNRELYDRFNGRKQLYSAMDSSDIRENFNVDTSLTEDERAYVEASLNVYGGLSGDQLETMTHQEEPWIIARHGFGPNDRCENNIDGKAAGQFYRSRLQHRE